MTQQKQVRLMITALTMVVFMSRTMGLCQYNWVPAQEGSRCCKNIECPRGKQPVLCTKDDPETTTCERCPHDQYNPDHAFLHNRDRCKLKTTCDSRYNLSYEHNGNSTHDAKCKCIPGYHMNRDKSFCLKTVLSTRPKSTVEQHNSTLPPVESFKEQDVGISVETKGLICASVGFFTLVIAIIIFFVIKRRLKKKKPSHNGCENGWTSNGTTVKANGGSKPLLPQATGCGKDGSNQGFEAQTQLCDFLKQNPDFDTKALDESISFLEGNLGGDWKVLGRKLFKDNPHIKMEYVDADTKEEQLKDKISHMLKKWTQVSGDRATMKELISAIRKCEFHKLAGDLCSHVVRHLKGQGIDI